MKVIAEEMTSNLQLKSEEDGKLCLGLAAPKKRSDLRTVR